MPLRRATLRRRRIRHSTPGNAIPPASRSAHFPTIEGVAGGGAKEYAPNNPARRHVRCGALAPPTPPVQIFPRPVSRPIHSRSAARGRQPELFAPAARIRWWEQSSPATLIRYLLIGLLLAGLARTTPRLQADEQPSPARPNVIVILTDDQGYNDVGFNGGKDIPTPHLDSIARNGVRFTNAYVTYAVCSPSRAGFITGRYQQRFGHERNPRWAPNHPHIGMSLAERTLADALGAAGYHCGLIGKWHLGAHPDFHPLRRGFHEFYGLVGGGKRYFPEDLTITHPRDARDEGESYRVKLTRGEQVVETAKYLTDEFSDEAVGFVERNRDRPFFLYLSYNAPHSPMQAPEPYLARFPDIRNPKRRTYAAMVSAVDDGVGRVLARLRELGLEKNTLVFFLSDNGGPTNDNASDNHPLRAGKSSPYEGGWRVPFAVQWPGRIPRRQHYDHPVSSLDIFATVAGVVGLPADAQRPLDGVNLLPHLDGTIKTPPHEAIYLRMYDRGVYAVRSGDFKLIIPGKDQAPELYNLRADIRETRNLAQSHPEQVARLEELRVKWDAEMIPPAFPGLQMPGASGGAAREKAKE